MLDRLTALLAEAPGDAAASKLQAHAQAKWDEAERQREEAERLEREENLRRWQKEFERLEAERRQREKEAERLEAERLEAERLEAERRQRLEAERLEAERIQRLLPAMVEVPAGPFLMGSTDQQIADAISQGVNADWVKIQKPQHTLTLPRYWIGKTPITNAQFRPFVDSDGYTNQAYWDTAGWQWRTEQKRTQPSYWNDANFNGDQQPVVGVTWYEAMAYTRWLSKKTGLHFSLPTEAEWEYAARGSKGLIYPWGNTWDAKRANSSVSGIGKTTPVGRYPNGASPYGALDMVGNVWEWTRSIYTAYPYNATDGRENLSDPAGKRFTLRGGSWNSASLYLRAAYRVYLTPAYDAPDVGLRLARHL